MAEIVEGGGIQYIRTNHVAPLWGQFSSRPSHPIATPFGHGMDGDRRCVWAMVRNCTPPPLECLFGGGGCHLHSFLLERDI